MGSRAGYYTKYKCSSCLQLLFKISLDTVLLNEIEERKIFVAFDKSIVTAISNIKLKVKLQNFVAFLISRKNSLNLLRI